MKIEENDELVIEPRHQRRHPRHPGFNLEVQDEMAIDDDDDEDWGQSTNGRGKSEDDDGVFGKMDV